MWPLGGACGSARILVIVPPLCHLSDLVPPSRRSRAAHTPHTRRTHSHGQFVCSCVGVDVGVGAVVFYHICASLAHCGPVWTKVDPIWADAAPGLAPNSDQLWQAFVTFGGGGDFRARHWHQIGAILAQLEPISVKQ